MFKSMRTSDYMQTDLPTVTPETDLFQAIHLILMHQVSGISVVNDNNEPIGMLSELDCLRAVLKGAYHQEVGGTVGEYMTSPCDTIGPSEDIIAVAQAMLDNKRRRRPVMHEGKLVGTVTCREILRAVKEWNVPSDPSEAKR